MASAHEKLIAAARNAEVKVAGWKVIEAAQEIAKEAAKGGKK